MTDSTWDLLTNPDDPRHGTVNGYINHGCQCDACTAANTEHVAKGRASRALREPPEDSHGKPSCYSNWGCRRPECREAHNAAARQRRALKRQQKEAS